MIVRNSEVSTYGYELLGVDDDDQGRKRDYTTE